MNIEEIAKDAEFYVNKHGIFWHEDASRFAPNGMVVNNGNIKIRLTNYPYEDPIIDIEYRDEKIMVYDSNLLRKSFYNENKEFEKYFFPLVALSLLRGK